MMTKLSTLAAKVRADVAWADANPNMNDMPAGSRHYRVRLRYKGRQMTVPFSCGPAIEHEPSAEDVLECLLSDSSGADEAFEDWCDDLGYDSDSRRAERTYKLIQAQAIKTRNLLGDEYDSFMAAER